MDVVKDERRAVLLVVGIVLAVPFAAEIALIIAIGAGVSALPRVPLSCMGFAAALAQLVVVVAFGWRHLSKSGRGKALTLSALCFPVFSAAMSAVWLWAPT